MAVPGQRSKSARTNCIWKVSSKRCCTEVSIRWCVFMRGGFHCRLTAILNSFRQSNVPLWKSAKKKKTNCFLCSENQHDHNCEIITYEGDRQALCNVTVKSPILLENRVKPVEEISAATLGEKRGAAQLIRSGSDHRAAGTDFLQAFTCSLLKRKKKKPLCADKCIYFSYFMWRQHTDAYTPRPVYVERDRLCTHSGAHNRLVNFISHKRIAASVQNERFQPGTDVGKG